jgi:spoIIIJ-associated protein
VEWVETTAKTVDDAKEAALDQLGVDEGDAEFEVLEEPRPGLFGRMRGEARVRARIAPRQPRPKVERRDRKKRDDSGSGATRSKRSSSGRAAAETAAPAAAGSGPAPDPAAEAAAAATPGRTRSRKRSPNRSTGAEGAGRSGGSDGTVGADPAGPGGTTQSDDGSKESPAMDDERLTVGQQADYVEEFLTGLLGAFGLEAEVVRTPVDDETIELALEGDELGLLIGPKGATIQALHEICRTVVQRQAVHGHDGRVRIDVAGYRERRRLALERFTQQVAEQVRESGVAKALEPMAPPDRKVVHDTVNELDGVSTISEGEEPRRRVVIQPAHP